MPEYILAFGLIAVILTVTALTSGLVERSPLSFPLMFLGFGFVLGQGALSVIIMDPHNPILEIVANITLSLVLFLDATKLQLEELGRRWLIPALLLGPGTGMIIVLSATPISFLLGFSWLTAFAGGAMLASTDPVVLREIIRDKRIPRSVRQVLRIEAGMNDLVVLPVILILIAISLGNVGSSTEWASSLGRLLILGPSVGVVVGGIGAWLLAKADAHTSIRSEYQALYGIGLVLASYASGTALGGDGFLASFAAGIAVVLLNQKLCDSFLAYGETSAEMAMLLAFVLFGAVLSGIIKTVSLVPALSLAAMVIFVIRPTVIGLVLARVKMSWEAHAFVSWFGPRGLNSLLLALLVVKAGLPESELLLALVGVVVFASVTIHGATATPISIWYGRRAAKETLEEERESTAAGLFSHHEVDVPLITPKELHNLLSNPDRPLILDVRTRSKYDQAGERIPRSIRVLPDQVAEWTNDLPRHRLIITYCS